MDVFRTIFEYAKAISSDVSSVILLPPGCSPENSVVKKETFLGQEMSLYGLFPDEFKKLDIWGNALFFVLMRYPEAELLAWKFSDFDNSMGRNRMQITKLHLFQVCSLLPHFSYFLPRKKRKKKCERELRFGEGSIAYPVDEATSIISTDFLVMARPSVLPCSLFWMKKKFFSY